MRGYKKVGAVREFLVISLSYQYLFFSTAWCILQRNINITSVSFMFTTSLTRIS